MSYVIVYRNMKEGRAYALVSDNAHGLREFSTHDAAVEFVKKESRVIGDFAKIVELSGL